MSLSLPSLSLPLSSRTQFVFSLLPQLSLQKEGSPSSTGKQSPASRKREQLLGSTLFCSATSHGDAPLGAKLLLQAEQRVSPKKSRESIPSPEPSQDISHGVSETLRIYLLCTVLVINLWVPLKLIELLPEQRPTTTALNSAVLLPFSVTRTPVFSAGANDVGYCLLGGLNIHQLQNSLFPSSDWFYTNGTTYFPASLHH